MSCTIIASSAQEIYLEFFIGKTQYNTSEGTKVLDAAPYIKNSRTMVPMRAIFEELGYFVEYDAKTSRVISSNGYKRMILTIGSNRAIIDGVEKLMPVAAETKNGRTFVPLAFVSENSGATVKWIDLNSPITVRAASRPEIGSFVLSEKLTTADKRALAVLNIFRNGKAEKIEIPGKQISNVVSFNDSFVITVLDPVLNTTQVMGYDGKLKLLQNEYDVKKTFEFNGNLVLHMYNRMKKIDELWRYDGSNLYQIDSDFNMGSFVVTDNQAIVSKSNSSRQYSIMKITKSSWVPQVLIGSFIIKDSLVNEDVVYMLGTTSTGTENWFYTYKVSTGVLQPVKIPAGVTVTLKDVYQTEKDIFVKIKNMLYVLRDTELNPVEFLENDIYVNVQISDAKIIGGKLHAIVTGLVASVKDVELNVSSTGVPTQKEIKYDIREIDGYDKTFMLLIDNTVSFTPNLKYQDLTALPNTVHDYKNMRASKPLSACAYARSSYSEMTKTENKGKDIKIASMRYYDNHLFLMGTNFAGDTYLRAWNLNTLSVGPMVTDIKTIQDIVKMPNGAYVFAVDDLNRLTNTTRKTVLELKNDVYRNIAVETQVMQMVIKNNSLMIYGKDIDLKTKIFNYDGSNFNSIGNSFAMAKWFNFDYGLTFISGKADVETKETLYLLNQTLTKAIPEFTLEKVVRLKQDIYGVVGKYNATVVDPDFKGKKLMIIFDAKTNKYTVVKASTAFELTASEY
jgi:hypothetical protein